MKLIAGVAYAIAQVAIQKDANAVIVANKEGGTSSLKKLLKKKAFIRDSKVYLCAGIAPMATYEADCWTGVCYSAACYAMGC